MSAPKTNIETQEKRHKPSLFGTRNIIVAVVAILAALLIWSAFNDPDDATDATPVTGTTEAPVTATE